MLKTNTDNEPVIKTLLGILNSILHIIESILSQEELPDYYEDQLNNLALAFTFVLDNDYPKLQKIPDELVKARAKVVRLVHLYTFKFGESF